MAANPNYQDEQLKQEKERQLAEMKETAPELYEFMRELYNQGMISGSRNLVYFERHQPPPYGLAATPPFTSCDYDPFSINPRKVNSVDMWLLGEPTIIEVTAKNVGRYYYRTHRTVKMASGNGSHRIPVWTCRRCEKVFSENLPPRHRCYGKRREK